jgi:hypothetical protein
MLIDSHQASRFISAYKAVLLELHHLSGEATHADLITNLASARSYLKGYPDSLGGALTTLELAGTAIARDIQQALKSLRIEQWVYLRSTTRYAIFLDPAANDAYAVLGLNNSVEEIVGTSAVAFEAGLFSFAGSYVCDGIIHAPILLGPGYRRQFSTSLADIRKRGRFHARPEPEKTPTPEPKHLE